MNTSLTISHGVHLKEGRSARTHSRGAGGHDGLELVQEAGCAWRRRDRIVRGSVEVTC